MGRFQGLIGVAVLLGIAWLLSNNRRRISLRIVLWGLGLQIVFALLILRSPLGYPFFNFLDRGVAQLLSFSDEGGAVPVQAAQPAVRRRVRRAAGPTGCRRAGDEAPPERLRLRAVKATARSRRWCRRWRSSSCRR